jgi:hypothetical protein
MHWLHFYCFRVLCYVLPYYRAKFGGPGLAGGHIGLYQKKKHRFIVLLVCYFYKTEAIGLSGPNASSCNFTLCNVMLIAAA